MVQWIQRLPSGDCLVHPVTKLNFILMYHTLVIQNVTAWYNFRITAATTDNTYLMTVRDYIV